MHPKEHQKIPVNAGTAKSRYASVMLIDDNRVDNFISSNIVGNFHFAGEITVYTEAKLALVFLSTCVDVVNGNQTTAPDFIFLDINMPVMNGFDFLNEFEKISFGKVLQPKVVMLSSSISKSDKDRAFGFKSVVKYLQKPLTEEELGLL